jgi:hypothetical protein
VRPRYVDIEVLQKIKPRVRKRVERDASEGATGARTKIPHIFRKKLRPSMHKRRASLHIFSRRRVLRMRSDGHGLQPWNARDT